MQAMMKKLLMALALIVSLSATAKADISTQLPPWWAPLECWYTSDGFDTRGYVWIGWWEPENASTSGWGDALGRRVDWCSGTPGTGDVDIFTNAGSCARLHGLTSTDQMPNGFLFDQEYVLESGWYGLAAPTTSVRTQIDSYVLGPNTHVTFCATPFDGTVYGPCKQASLAQTSGSTVVMGTVPFATYAVSVGTNEAIPPACGATPAQMTYCYGKAKSGLPTAVGGDGLVRNGGYTIGNPVTGPGGVPCLSQDLTKLHGAIVLVYPVQGQSIMNPDGTQSFQANCP